MEERIYTDVDAKEASRHLSMQHLATHAAMIRVELLRE